MRRKEGDALRLFNGRDGEWRAELSALGKKSAQAIVQEQLFPQPPPGRAIHLVFAPIKKNRMDFLIEKAAELGATHIHPVLTQNTEIRQLNEERINAQLIEAAEQCERLTVPALAPLQKLDRLLGDWPQNVPLYACIERYDAPLLKDISATGDAAILVGPEGGFTADEAALLTSRPFIRPVSLGTTILRAETACLKALSLL